MSVEDLYKFTLSDIETLIEAVGDWELVNNQDFNAMIVIKNLLLPPEDSQDYEGVKALKKHFAVREKDIMASRSLRQEIAVFLKAKLYRARRELGICKLFDMASGNDDKEATLVTAEKPVNLNAKDDASTLKKRLELAEAFIDDLKVRSYYEKFIEDRKNADIQS
jgi:hypothetical protein